MSSLRNAGLFTMLTHNNQMILFLLMMMEKHSNDDSANPCEVGHRYCRLHNDHHHKDHHRHQHHHQGCECPQCPPHSLSGGLRLLRYNDKITQVRPYDDDIGDNNIFILIIINHDYFQWDSSPRRSLETSL